MPWQSYCVKKLREIQETKPLPVSFEAEKIQAVFGLLHLRSLSILKSLLPLQLLLLDFYLVPPPLSFVSFMLYYYLMMTVSPMASHLMLSAQPFSHSCLPFQASPRTYRPHASSLTCPRQHSSSSSTAFLTCSNPYLSSQQPSHPTKNLIPPLTSFCNPGLYIPTYQKIYWF